LHKLKTYLGPTKGLLSFGTLHKYLAPCHPSLTQMYGASGPEESSVQGALSALALHSLTTEQLKELLNDDDSLADKLNDLPAVQSLRNGRDTAVASNKSLAEYNLSLQPRIMELKSKVRGLLEETDTLEAELREKRDKLSVVDQPLDTTLALLQTAAAQTEEESEDLVQSMLRGEMSLDNFLELYLPKRRVAIARRVKVDKLKELVRSPGGVYRPPAPSSSPYQPPAPAATPYPSATPYPPQPNAIPYPPQPGATPYPPQPGYGNNVPYPTPYPPAGPSGPAMPYPYMPGGMPLPRY